MGIRVIVRRLVSRREYSRRNVLSAVPREGSYLMPLDARKRYRAGIMVEAADLRQSRVFAETKRET